MPGIPIKGDQKILLIVASKAAGVAVYDVSDSAVTMDKDGAQQLVVSRSDKTAKYAGGDHTAAIAEVVKQIQDVGA